ncbi:MAG TPA: CaiB/BaiF CoA-transferase family protein [Burkholderiales bacterium]|nr:CaiB/BaiF CoA-transferase family protein [Burkholderiales bacterium]
MSRELPAGPLDGYRVLELGSTVAGPFCGRLFADFGAEVIKVEPVEGDPVRSMGRRCEGKSLYAASLFRNKSLISIDLRTDKGRDIVRRLADKCDFLIENFRPGTLESWGLGYDALSTTNPGLIMVRISGYGQTGPYSSWPGYGVICEAVSGLRHLTGDADRPPGRVATSMTDYITGLYAAFGALLALEARHSTGKGQIVDAALYESAFSFMEPHVPAYQKLGVVAMRAGSRLPGNTPNNLYPTGDGQYVHVTAASDAVFRRLAQAIGKPEMITDERFATAIARIENEDAVDEAIGAWTAQRDCAEVEKVLRAAKVPASHIYTIADIFNDPHYAARGMLANVPDNELGTVTLANVVPRLLQTPGEIRRSGGRVGQDTARVLRELAGMNELEIDALKARDVISCDPHTAPTRDVEASEAS